MTRLNDFLKNHGARRKTDCISCVRELYQNFVSRKWKEFVGQILDKGRYLRTMITESGHTRLTEADAMRVEGGGGKLA